MGDFAATLSAVLGVVAALLAAALSYFFSSRGTAKQESAERQRLRSEIYGSTAKITITTPSGRVSGISHVEDEAAVDSAAGSPGPQEAQGHGTGGQPPKEPPSSRPPGNGGEDDRPPGNHTSPVGKHGAERDAAYDQLLIDGYALGLTQARRAFNISMAFSVLGGLVLVLGIALAIFRADTGGQEAGAAITTASGALTAGLSQLFRGQSSKALTHFASQASELRHDVRAQENSATALRLLNEVADVELRSQLQAALIVKFTNAKLPDSKRPSKTQGHKFDGRAASNGDKGGQSSPLTAG
jgi:hypothetical protein